MESSNGSFWPYEGFGLERISGLVVDGLILLAKPFFSVDVAVHQPLRSQHSPVILCLNFGCGLSPFLSLSLTTPPPLPSSTTCDATLLIKLFRFSILRIWQEALQAATTTGSGLKGNRLMHL